MSQMQSEFERAARFAKTLPESARSRENTAVLYGLFKVATVGAPPDQCQKSGFLEQAKHEAWTEAYATCLFDSETAKREYVKRVDDLLKSSAPVPPMPVSRR